MNKKMSLSAESLLKKYGSKTVVDNVSVEVKQGEIVGLLGPNGAGKTTTFYSIVGLIKPDSGLVYIGKENITKLPMYQRARKGIGYLAQEASVFRNLSVRDNILAVLEGTDLSKEEQIAKTEKLLSEFSLEDVQDSMGMVLSGGERRRTEIARALATEPKFILLDEPFAGIDPLTINEIKNIISKLRAKNVGVVISDHNAQATMDICDNISVINNGEIIASGNSSSIKENNTVQQIYLGENLT